MWKLKLCCSVYRRASASKCYVVITTRERCRGYVKPLSPIITKYPQGHPYYLRILYELCAWRTTFHRIRSIQHTLHGGTWGLSQTACFGCSYLCSWPRFRNQRPSGSHFLFRESCLTPSGASSSKAKRDADRTTINGGSEIKGLTACFTRVCGVTQDFA